jgi:hypothetical protein
MNKSAQMGDMLMCRGCGVLLTPERARGGQSLCEKCAATNKKPEEGANAASSRATAAPIPSRTEPSPSSSQSATDSRSAIPASAHPILPKITCPHCWQRFRPEELLRISRHADLLGDQVLGSDAPLRFLPSRFDVSGNALDARGMACQSLACPRCHLMIPRALTEIEAFLRRLSASLQVESPTT